MYTQTSTKEKEHATKERKKKVSKKEKKTRNSSVMSNVWLFFEIYNWGKVPKSRCIPADTGI